MMHGHDKLVGFRGTKEVGNNQLFIESGGTVLGLDLGLPISSPLYTGDYGDRPRHIRDHLKLKEIPSLDGLLRPELAKSAGLKATEQPFSLVQFLSHTHVDHMGALWSLNGKTTVFSLPLVYQMAQIHEELSEFNDVRNDITRLRQVPRPKKEWVVVFRTVNKQPKMITGYAEDAVEKRSRMEEGAPRPWHASAEFKFDGIEMQARPVEHSTEASAVFGQTRSMTFSYTGDFREGPNSDRYFDYIHGQTDVLLIEGTNVNKMRNGAKISELGDLIFAELTKVRGPSAYVIAYSRNDVRTFIEAKKAAIRQGLFPIVLPKDMRFFVRVESVYPGASSDLGVLRKSEDHTSKDDKLKGIPKNTAVYTDAEIRRNISKYALMLAPSSGEHWKLLDLEPHGGVFIDTTSDAHDEERRISRETLKSFIAQFGLSPSHIHTSGHAYQPYILEKIEYVKPKSVLLIHVSSELDRETGVPVHELYKSLVEKRLGDNVNVFVPTYGETYSIIPGQTPTITEPITSSYSSQPQPTPPPQTEPPKLDEWTESRTTSEVPLQSTLRKD